MKKVTGALAVVCLLSIVQVQLFAQSEEGARVRLPDEDVIGAPIVNQQFGSLSKAGAVLSRFAEEHQAWQFRVNERTNTPHRAWGDGIQVQGFPSVNLLNAPAAGRQFVADHADVLGIDPSALRLMYSEIANGKVYQKFIQQVDGIDVLHSYVDVRMTTTGRVIMFGSDCASGISVPTTPAISASAARAYATLGISGDVTKYQYEDKGLAILPLNYVNGTQYRLVQHVVVTTDPEHMWDVHVDAQNGTVLWRRNLVVNFRGPDTKPAPRTATVNVTVKSKLYPDSWLLGAKDVPVPFAYVNVGGKMYTTDADGKFTADLSGAGSAPVIARLSGPYALARRADTNGVAVKNAIISTTATDGADLEIMWDDSNSAASERNVFYHITRVRNWIRGLDPSVNLSRLDGQMTGLVNINSSCNANWDGTRINFYAKSAQCANTAEIADVIYHEFGHAINTFLYSKLMSTALQSGALGEATADINANMLRDDPRIGIGFMLGGANEGIIRLSDNKLHYPEDLVNEIHDDGMILTGAVWDVRKAIGLETTTRLAHYAKYGCPDGTNTGMAFADYFIEFLLADDDNGSLADGTPHSAQIIPAFIAHGIPASGISVSHTPLADQTSTTVGYPISATVAIGATIDANLLTIADAKVIFSSDNWATSGSATLSYNPTTKTVSGTFPPQEAGKIVHYYLELTDNYGSVMHSPALAPKSDHVFLVGYLRKYYDDMESDDKWTVYGDAATGEWLRATPIGTYNGALGRPPAVPYVQPNSDHTPTTGATKCWVTGNGTQPSQLGEEDVDDGSTVLTSIDYDITGMIAPVLRYYRWYTNDQGATPGTDSWIVRLSSDGGKTWNEIENTKQSELSWKPIVLPLTGVVNFTSNLRIQFEAADLDSGSLVEAAVDDFEILDVNAALGVHQVSSKPGSLQLSQNFPNPFNPTTTLQYALPVSGQVRLSVYSAAGALVSTLVNASQSPGEYTATFDGAALPSGIYTAVLEFGGSRLYRSMALVK